MNSHVAELDDGVRYGVLHPGSPIISALLSVAEKENISSNDLNNLYENDFEFNRIGDSVKEIIKISEDVVQ